MTRREKIQLRQTTLLGVAVTLIVAAVDHFGWLSSLENWLYDQRARHCRYFTPPPTDRLVHLDIDDSSLEAIGRWPWPRATLASVVDELHAVGAKTIAFDVVFSDPQPVQWVGDLTGDFRKLDHDALFSEAIGRHGNVVLPIAFVAAGRRSPLYQQMVHVLMNDLEIEPPAMISELERVGLKIGAWSGVDMDRFVVARAEAIYKRIDRLSGADPTLGPQQLRSRLLPRTVASGITDSALTRLLEKQSLLVQAERSAQRFAIAHWDRAVSAPGASAGLPPIPSLSDAASSVGSVYYTPDDDGVVRSVDLLVEYRGRLFPQLGLAAACDYLGIDVRKIRIESDRLDILGPSGPDSDIRLPLHSRPAATGSTFSDLAFDLPWFGKINAWETMYDPAHRAPTQHLPVTAVWRAIETRQAIVSNNRYADDAIGFLLANSDLSKLASFQEHHFPIEDPFVRRPLIESLLNDPYILEVLRLYQQQRDDAQPLDESGVRFLASYEALTTLSKQTQRLGEQLTQQRLALGEAVGNKAVLVGWTATAAVADFVPTSLHTKCPGVAVHGVVFNAILTGEIWRRTPPWMAPAITVAMGVLATVFRSVFNTRAATISCLILLIGHVFFDGYVAFDYGNRLLASAAPLTAIVSVWAIVTVYRFVVERADRARITRRFQRYVDPALVNYVAEHAENARFDGQVRELTVVFTDLVGFTTITEKLQERTVQILNEYMEMMVPIIRAQQGYVNKFLGDGIMFFFGAPMPNPRHARDAILTAIKLRRAMRDFNTILNAKGLPPLNMRVGISSGLMVVGDAGPANASDYTVLGDAVNLGARLESANKQTGTWILCNDRAKELAGDEFLFRPVGLLNVVGKTSGVMTYEPLCLQEDAAEPQRLIVHQTTEMVQAFIAGDFEKCLIVADLMTQTYRDCRLAQLYLDLVTRYMQTPPINFAGQIVLESK
jgi:CHASE2 domain-containing sensor protein